MDVPVNALAQDVRPTALAQVRDYVALTKPRLSSLVWVTTAGGMWLAQGNIPMWRLVVTLLATVGIVGAANALNCYLERDRDRLMARTASRPLPQGRMEPDAALKFGGLLAIFSIPLMAWSANLLTAVLALAAFVSYVFWYTPMKAKSSWAMWVGAIPGALPPLMGWTSVTGRMDLPGWVLFGILFFWQLPHFLAIALFRKEEYRRAGLLSVPLVSGDAVARFQAAVLSLVLIPLSVALVPLGVAGMAYGLTALMLGLAFFGMALWGVWTQGDTKWARRFFGMSLFYLCSLFVALALDVGFFQKAFAAA